MNRKQHVGAASTTISASSMDVAARRSHRTRQNLPRYLSASGGLRRANAERWFNDSNQNPTHTRHASFIDSKPAMFPSAVETQTVSDDPPFYLRDQSSTTMDSACAVLSDRHTHSRWNTPHPGASGRTKSSGSTSEEFRGVIDDLTVTNRKLRERLKKYENLHCSHLQKEKLFEVRVHALPVQRKLELEHFLRGLAASLGGSSDAPEFAPNSEPTTSLLDPLSSLPNQPCSSSTSYSKPHDSTYASVSASGQTLNSQSNPKTVRSSKRLDAKRRDVKSYLREIPPGLLPRRSPFLSTKVKRKVVVRRLEQLFTGHGGVSMNYNQCHQQQEVSQSAAQVEREGSGAGEARLEVEGVREARILPVMSHARDHHERDEGKPGSELSSREGTPDQRPTRPLDLDLHRAQVPADNMQYIKHLGIASPVAESSGEAGFMKGWVYLNLLVGMAQLHTLNVTVGFIRKAIVDISTKFELSADGRKIRWIGGDKGTPLSSDSDESTESMRGILPEDDPAATRRQPTGGRRQAQLRSEVQSGVVDTSHLSTCHSSGGSAEADPHPLFLAPSNSVAGFHYKPLIFRRVSSEDEDLYNYDEDSCTLSRKAQDSNLVESHSGGAQVPAPNSNVTERKEGGPIIYYKNANFCTDLSGDLNYDSRDDVAFTRYVKDPIGCDEGEGDGGVGCDSDTTYSQTSHKSRNSADAHSDSSGLTDTCLTLEDMSLTDAEDAPSRIKPIYFEASGLGGVQPQDNFCVEVKVQHGGPRSLSGGGDGEISFSDHSPPHGLRQSMFSPAVTEFHRMQAAKARQARGPISKPKILAYTVMPLPHSVLPEPSYINLPFSSDNDEEEDEGSSENSESDGNRKAVRSDWFDEMDTELEKPMPLEKLFGLTDGSSVENWDTTLSEDSEDSSIDILAHARVLDPETVAAREREYDSNMGMPLAEVPAGSSAATAGGGSGLPSEMSSAYSDTTEEGNSGRPSVKRRRL